jgi:hypothetical protein
MNRVGLRGFSCLLAALGLASCIDMTPLQDGPGDAGADSGFAIDAAVEFTCRVCVFGVNSPCRSEWSACEANEKCRLVTECATARGCLPLMDLGEQTVCALPCLDEVGLKSNTDPAILLGLTLNVCKISNCKQECGAGGGG